MATDAPSPQRAYRAACPNCGATVEFRSAASALAVCGFCRSTLLREGEALRRIGQSAELFDDHSPLQLGASGRWQGAGFTLVGRLQWRYAGGSWNEWHALFEAGKSGWLSEDNGGYVISFDAPTPADVPPAETLRVGAQHLIDRQAWSVASVTTASIGAAEGELPRVPDLQREHRVAELRNAGDEVASIDYGPGLQGSEGGDERAHGNGRAPRWSVGRGLQLATLALTGLRDASARDLVGQSLACPSCGAALAVQLSSTLSIVCQQCHAVVDVSQGVGAALAHYAQDTPGVAGGEPLIPLGQSGTLALGATDALPWQVVGYVERCTLPEPGEDDEQSFWREYLLYHRTAGFAFLVDAEDGWSWVRPTTGAPRAGSSEGDGVRWQGAHYRELDRYTGQITYVLGEFYWRLERGQRTLNTDYQGPGGKRLNREQTGAGANAELTWSAGAALDAKALMRAFKLDAALQPALQRDVGPVAGGGAGALAAIALFLLIVVLLFSLVRCSRDDCDQFKRSYGAASNEYQQCARASGGVGGVRGYGGSYGGFSTGGGGHK